MKEHPLIDYSSVPKFYFVDQIARSDKGNTIIEKDCSNFYHLLELIPYNCISIPIELCLQYLYKSHDQSFLTSCREVLGDIFCRSTVWNLTNKEHIKLCFLSRFLPFCLCGIRTFSFYRGLDCLVSRFYEEEQNNYTMDITEESKRIDKN